jgi:hypothetical protein
MKSFEGTGKTAIVVVASAAGGALFGILLYALRVSINRPYWGNNRHEIVVLMAIRGGLMVAVVLFLVLRRRIHRP